MDEKAAATIDAYIPAAHLMVKARACTDTLNEAVEWVQQRDNSFKPAYLRLLWVGINAQCLSHENHKVDLIGIHPDYEPEDQPVFKLATQSPTFAQAVNDAIAEVAFSEEEGRQWLGTYKVNRQTYQLQLVLTNIDSHFVDEG